MGATSPGQGSDLGAFCRKLTSPKSIFSPHNSRASHQERQKPCPQASKLRFPSLSLDFLPPLGPQQNLPLLAFPPWSKRICAATSGAGARGRVRHRRYTLTTTPRLLQGPGHEGQSCAGHVQNDGWVGHHGSLNIPHVAEIKGVERKGPAIQNQL